MEWTINQLDTVTNVSWIRGMSDEELAEWLCGILRCNDCPGIKTCGVNTSNYKHKGIIDWLHQSIEGDKKNEKLQNL